MTAFLALPLDPKLATANLDRFGPIHPLLSASNKPTIWDGSALIEAFHQALVGHCYDPGLDHIVLSGPAVYLTVLTIAVWEYVDRYHPADTGVSFLVYDGSAGIYKELRLPRARK